MRKRKKREKNEKLTLHSRQPNPSRRRMHKHDITGLDARPHHQRSVARRRRDEEAGGVAERPTLGHGQQRHLADAQLRREGALRGAEDARADGEARARAGPARDGEDDAGEFGAGDPREGCCTASQLERNGLI